MDIKSASYFSCSPTLLEISSSVMPLTMMTVTNLSNKTLHLIVGPHEKFDLIPLKNETRVFTNSIFQKFHSFGIVTHERGEDGDRIFICNMYQLTGGSKVEIRGGSPEVQVVEYIGTLQVPVQVKKEKVFKESDLIKGFWTQNRKDALAFFSLGPLANVTPFLGPGKSGGALESERLAKEHAEFEMKRLKPQEWQEKKKMEEERRLEKETYQKNCQEDTEKVPAEADFTKPAAETQIIKHMMQPRPEDNEHNFETYSCPAHDEINLLSGAMKISCRDNPIIVKARICLPQDFDNIVSKMKEIGLVS